MSKEYQKSWREKQRSSGHCRECKNAVLEGHTRCERHLIIHAYCDQVRRLERRMKGLCQKCGQPVELNFRHCKKHLQYFSEYRQKRRTDGCCIKCGLLLHPDVDAGRVTCMFCREGLTGRGDNNYRYRGNIEEIRSNKKIPNPVGLLNRKTRDLLPK